MDATGIAEVLGAALPGVPVEMAPSVDLQSTFYVQATDLLPVLQALRDQDGLKFEVLAEMTAADYWPREPRFEVIYLLISVQNRLRVRLKVRLPGDDPHVATATGLWSSANWLEREIWDMFGIAFDGHPDPRRLLMPEDWEGHPARKDYPVQIHMKPESGSATQVTEEEFRASLLRDRLVRK
jgi:NADH-quinone oxidoreductase subunit C